MPNPPETPTSTVKITNTSETEAVKVVEPPESAHEGPTTIGPGETRAFERPVGSYLTVENFAQDAFIRTINVLPKIIETSLGSFIRVGEREWKDAQGRNLVTERYDAPVLSLKNAEDTVRAPLVLTVHGPAVLSVWAGSEWLLQQGSITALIGGPITIEVNTLMDRVEDLRPKYSRLPNVDPVLSSYDPRTTYVDNIKLGIRQHVFEPLDDKSRDYTIADGDYIVQNGVVYNTLNTFEGKAHSRIVTTSHEYSEAWGIGVSLSVGKPATQKTNTKSHKKGKISSGSATTKLPVGGTLSFAYEQEKSRYSSNTSGYSFSWQQTDFYELTAAPDALKLQGDFIEAVRSASKRLGAPNAKAIEFVKQTAELQEKFEKLVGLEDQDPDPEAPAGFHANVIKTASAEFRQELLKVDKLRDEAIEGSYGVLSEFVDTWGTHFAHKVVFGKTATKTVGFSIEELRTLDKKGWSVGVGAKGNKYGVDVEADLNYTHEKAEEFSNRVQESTTLSKAIGGTTMDSAEPIKADLRPLTELLEKRYFGSAWDSTFVKFQEQLEDYVSVLLEAPDIYPVLSRLRIWKIRFDGFTICENIHSWLTGSIALESSTTPFEQTKKRLSLFNRSQAMKVSPFEQEPFSHSGLSEHDRTAHLLFTGDIDESNAHQLKVNLTCKGPDKRYKDDVDLDLRLLKSRKGEIWVNGRMWIKYHAEKVDFHELPGWKRLEIARSLRSREGHF